MFSFDVTLIVQMLHFCFAWFLLDTFLFRYLYAEYVAEKNKKLALVNDLADQKNQIKNIEEQKKLHWDAFKEKSKSILPLFRTQSQSQEAVVGYEPNQPFSLEEKQQVIASVASKLTEQVMRD